MNNVFNTPFEISVRVLLTLSVQNQPISFDLIYISDFLTTYGRDFEITETNLNGDNSYHFSEFVTRRSLTQDAIKKLILQRLVKPSQNKQGFLFELTDSGKAIVPEFISVYAEKYLEAANQTTIFLKGKKEADILKLINTKAKSSKGDLL